MPVTYSSFCHDRSWYILKLGNTPAPRSSPPSTRLLYLYSKKFIPYRHRVTTLRSIDVPQCWALDTMLVTLVYHTYWIQVDAWQALCTSITKASRRQSHLHRQQHQIIHAIRSMLCLYNGRNRLLPQSTRERKNDSRVTRSDSVNSKPRLVWVDSKYLLLQCCEMSSYRLVAYLCPSIAAAEFVYAFAQVVLQSVPLKRT